MPHKQANALFIQYAINDFNWDYTFSNVDIDNIDNIHIDQTYLVMNYVLVKAHMRFRVNPHSVVV